MWIIPLTLLLAACNDPGEHLATAVIHNDTTSPIQIRHCADNCDHGSSDGSHVRPGGDSSWYNVPSNGSGFEPFVIFGIPGKPIACLHVQDKGPSGGRITVQASAAYGVAR